MPATERLLQKEEGKGTVIDAALMMKNQLGTKSPQNDLFCLYVLKCMTFIEYGYLWSLVNGVMWDGFQGFDPSPDTHVSVIYWHWIMKQPCFFFFLVCLNTRLQNQNENATLTREITAWDLERCLLLFVNYHFSPRYFSYLRFPDCPSYVTLCSAAHVHYGDFINC